MSLDSLVLGGLPVLGQGCELVPTAPYEPCARPGQRQQTTTDCDGTDESQAMTVMLSQPTTLALHPDRLLPADPAVRNIAPRLYAAVRDLPITAT